MRALVWARALPQVKLCSNVECSTLLLFYLFLWAANKDWHCCDPPKLRRLDVSRAEFVKLESFSLV